jgi:hypothetical protein
VFLQSLGSVIEVVQIEMLSMYRPPQFIDIYFHVAFISLLRELRVTNGAAVHHDRP